MKKKKLLYLDEKNYKKLQMMCLILGRSVSSYIDELIANELKKRGNNEKFKRKNT